MPETSETKIPSGKPAIIRLNPLPKLLDKVLEKYSPLVVAFKLEREPETKAKRMIERGVSLVLMNPPETMGSTSGNYVQLSAKGRVPCSGTKEEIAESVWKTLLCDHIPSA
jgi:phosphopantothenoylcysteine decarboxylase/phosphopantothenate--cysteine ligase